jgi:hypothetical protein
MKSDSDVLHEVRTAFAERVRPEHFTNFAHCEECAEHDELLRSRDVDSLSLPDVGNPGWDPICFITPPGFAYYLPALARLVLDSEESDAVSWYGSQLLFHLCSDGADNARVKECSIAERNAVAVLLRHIAETRAELIDRSLSADQLFEALRYWDENHTA